MKKKFYSIIFATFLTVWSIKPATAQLVIDGTEFGGKVAEWGQVILDSGGKNIQQVMQDALMQGQGFAIDALKRYVTDFIKNAILKDNKAANETVEGSTQQKNTELKEADRDNYKEGIQAEYENKYEIAVAELEKEKGELSKYKSLCNSAKREMEYKQREYEQSRGVPGQEEVKFDEYSHARSHAEDVCATKEGLEEKVKDQQQMVAMLEEEKSIVGTMADPKYAEMQARVDAINDNVVDESIVQAEGESEQDWAQINDMSNFVPPAKEYEEFFERYFYNPEGDADVLTTQTKLEKVKRERDFLLVNTTAHLLQVTASARREIPVRSHLVKEAYENTKTESGETAAMNAFSQTRIENARALLLYAKLLSAKLQYTAARSLYTADVQLERDDASPDKVKYGEFDMQHYSLTKEYKEFLKDTSNDATVSNKMQSIE